MSINFEVGSRTDVGKRKKNNEDCAKIVTKKRLFIVADGVGGVEHGEVAAKIAVDTIAKEFIPREISTLAIVTQFAHKKIKDEAALKGGKMYTTLTALHITSDNKAHFVHVGDSRLYHFSDGHLEQLTEDHTMENYLIKIGHIEKGAYVPPHLKNTLTQALGFKNITPQQGEHATKPGSVYLVCSDGLTKHVSDEEIKTLLERVHKGELHSRRAANELVRMANAGGGHDNTTVIVVKTLQKHVRA